MKIKQLELHSFRGINHLNLEFSPTNLTVIIGVNGVGKSNILDAIAIFLSHLISRIQDYPSNKRAFSQTDISTHHRFTQNKITLEINNQTITWSAYKSRSRKTKPPINEQQQLEPIVDQIQNNIINQPLSSLPLAIYYPVNRAVLDTPIKINRRTIFRPFDAYDEALTKQVDFKGFFQWFRFQQELEKKQTQETIPLAAVKRAIANCHLGLSHPKIKYNPLRMVIEKENQELIVNHQISDGEKCLLALIGDLARRLALANPTLSDPLQGKGIILIDEIELHLHPSWQRGIIPNLTKTFPNCQFIITTHSPQIISEVDANSIYSLLKQNDNIIINTPSASYGRDTNRILEDIMEVSDRPVAIKQAINQLFNLIDLGEIDSAKLLKSSLEQTIGEDDPEFIKADILIHRKEQILKIH